MEKGCIRSDCGTDAERGVNGGSGELFYRGRSVDRAISIFVEMNGTPSHATQFG